jgi:hypothetical protein
VRGVKQLTNYGEDMSVDDGLSLERLRECADKLGEQAELAEIDRRLSAAQTTPETTDCART